MEPITFDKANTTFGKNQPEYIPLPALKVDGDKTGKVITKWKLSKEELEKINETGTIYLSMLTFDNPLQPVMLSVDFPDD